MLFDYEARADDECTLRTGEVVRCAVQRMELSLRLSIFHHWHSRMPRRVLSKENGTWWRCEVDGTVGLVPSSYMQEL